MSDIPGAAGRAGLQEPTFGSPCWLTTVIGAAKGVEVSALIAISIATAIAFLALAALHQRGARGGGASWPQRLPFLGGGTPETHAWQRFHVRYYTMTLLFIAFEMEMMFMYPWAVVFVEEGLKALAEMGMFLAILAIGILYGWREGIFRWQ
jgi:NADH-quinone oxidoreductase subunit A